MILIVLRYKSKLMHYFLFQSIEDFILLVGTSVAFIAFILWCCFPIEPKDSLGGSEHLTTQVPRHLTKSGLADVSAKPIGDARRHVCTS